MTHHTSPLAAACALALFSTSSLGFAAEYFIDPAGDNSAPGTSAGQPWADLANLSRLEAGDTVNFRAGGAWQLSGGIEISNVTFQAYGDGPGPRIEGVNIEQWDTATIKLQDNAIVEGLTVTADGWFGFYRMGDNNVLRNCEIDGTNTRMVIAVGNMGSNNVITGNYAHDLDASTGDTGDPNSSGGAEGFVVFGGRNVEVSYNRGVRLAGVNETLGGSRRRLSGDHQPHRRS
jgi:hypothetical protein